MLETESTAENGYILHWTLFW